MSILYLNHIAVRFWNTQNFNFLNLINFTSDNVILPAGSEHWSHTQHTGLALNASIDDCSGWSDSSVLSNGAIGINSSTSVNFFISPPTYTCDQQKYLICISD